MRTTFVTAYYEFANKYSTQNRSESTYFEWMTNFFSVTSSDLKLVIFCTGKIYTEIVNRFSKKNIIIVDEPFENFFTYKYMKDLSNQAYLDPEKYIHNVYLYMIWNEKPYFVKRAIDLNFFGSTSYCWIDAGMVRDMRLSSLLHCFPNDDALSFLESFNTICVLSIETNNLHLFQDRNENNISNINCTPHTFYSVGGGCIFGTTYKYLEYIDKYKNLFISYIKNNIFVGKDQNLISNLIANIPDLFTIIDCNRIYTWLNKYQRNKWFRMINVLTGFKNRVKIRTPKLVGGLGNRLFQLGFVYNLSRQINTSIVVINPKFVSKNHQSKIDYSNTIFKRFVYDRVDRFDKILVEKQNHYHSFDPDYLSYMDENILYYGFFQNYKYTESILEDFSKLLELPETPVSDSFFIHIRLGDYVQNKDHFIDLKLYYLRCIDIIKRKYGDKFENIKFHVFSDNIKSLTGKMHSFLGINEQNLIFEDSDELTSLSQMINCQKGGISANSTFSWWASILNSLSNQNPDKLFFYPNKQYPSGSIYEVLNRHGGLNHPILNVIEVD